MHQLPESFVLIVLAGAVQDREEFLAVQTLATETICTDSAAEYAKEFGATISLIIGDLDSISGETLSYFSDRGVEIIRNPDQNSDDFEKSLDYVSSRFSGHVRVVGVSGLRIDHTLTNYSVALRYTDRFESLHILDAFSEQFFLTTARPECLIDCEIGTTISLLPFGEARGIVTQNLHYPLRDEELRVGVREGLSNVATGESVAIRIREGSLLVTVNHSAT